MTLERAKQLYPKCEEWHSKGVIGACELREEAKRIRGQDFGTDLVAVSLQVYRRLAQEYMAETGQSARRRAG